MTIVAELVDNPYASPAPVPAPPAAIIAPPPAPGSLLMILGGFALLLVGYLTSNLFLISDLYQLSLGPNGQHVPSPFAAAFTTAPQQWLLYAICGGACVAGAVMIGSQRYNPLAIVCFVMCPLAAAVYAIATPLRIARRFAEPVATLYLLVGSCLAFTGATRLLILFGQPASGFAPVLASMLTQAGLALAVGAIIKFWRTTGQSAASQQPAAIMPDSAVSGA